MVNGGAREVRVGAREADPAAPHVHAADRLSVRPQGGEEAAGSEMRQERHLRGTRGGHSGFGDVQRSTDAGAMPAGACPQRLRAARPEARRR